MLTKERIHQRAAEMEACPTFSEARAAESMQAAGIEFYPQVVLGRYILDFVVPSKLLVVEIDGATHEEQQLYDAFRDAFCNALGLTVLRIPNSYAYTAAARVLTYPDQPDALEKMKTALRCANGKASGERVKKKAKEPNPERERIKSFIKDKKRKAAQKQEAARLANAAAKEAGLPSPRSLRQKARRAGTK